MFHRKCPRCKKEKLLSSKYFYRNRIRKLGFEYYCKKCSSFCQNKRRNSVEGKIKEKQQKKKYRQKNRERINLRANERYRKNRIYILKRNKELRIKNNKKFRINRNKRGNGLLRLRFKILVRDDFTCRYCGRKPPEVVLQIDHIIPRAKKGELFNEDNLITSCWECNIGKGDILLNYKKRKNGSEKYKRNKK